SHAAVDTFDRGVFFAHATARFPVGAVVLNRTGFGIRLLNLRASANPRAIGTIAPTLAAPQSAHARLQQPVVDLRRGDLTRRRAGADEHGPLVVVLRAGAV